MTPRIPVAPDMRAAQIRQLIDRAQREGEVPLIALSAMELCVLGAPKYPLVSASIARAWASLSPRMQTEAVGVFTRNMASRGHLLEAGQEADGTPVYSPSPELGVILAARYRPAFIVATGVPGVDHPQPALYALGDEQNPVQAMVAEVAAALAPSRRLFHRPPMPLRSCFGYLLFSVENAAGFLAKWMILPTHGGRSKPPLPRTVALVHPRDQRGTFGSRISVWGDRTTARVDTGGQAEQTEHDLDGLRAIMLELITSGDAR
jgi:hypothetical protein